MATPLRQTTRGHPGLAPLAPLDEVALASRSSTEASR
jgi:hypothetical protein